MIEDEIIENNLLLANYMELPINKELYSYKSQLYSINGLQYHKDWNWLFSVIEKLEKVGFYIHSTAHNLYIIEYMSGEENIDYEYEIDYEDSKIENWFLFICGFIIKLNIVNLSIDEYYKTLMKYGYITFDGQPIKCIGCQSNNYNDKVTEYINYDIIEHNRYCNNCNMLMGIWRAGSWLT